MRNSGRSAASNCPSPGARVDAGTLVAGASGRLAVGVSEGDGGALGLVGSGTVAVLIGAEVGGGALAVLVGNGVAGLAVLHAASSTRMMALIK